MRRRTPKNPSLHPFENALYVVLGLGQSGLGTAQAIIRNKGEAWVWDDRPEVREIAASLGLKVVDLMTADLSGVRALVLSPGIPLYFPEPHPVVARMKKYGIPVTGDIDLFYKLRPSAHYIGVTGTNGKSTTSMLIGHLLKTAEIPHEVGGNIGIPVLNLPLLPWGRYVLELSSYQLDLVENLRCQTAILLNLGVDHLDRHGTMDRYIAAKKRIFNHQKGQNNRAIIGVDDEYSQKVYEEMKNDLDFSKRGVLIPISGRRAVAGGVYAENGWLVNDTRHWKEKIISLEELKPLQGAHNYQNVAAAVASLLHFRIREDILRRGLQTFPGISHRQEIIGEKGALVFVNDSKGTNVEATAHALATYDNIYWIAGGKPKGDDLMDLLPYFPKIRHAYLIGEAAPAFAEVLSRYISVTISGDLKKAVEQAVQAAKNKGGVILLSPACASYDQFKNFEERGDLFRSYVKEILDVCENG